MISIKKILICGRGSEIAEAALVLPLALLILLGIYMFGRAFNTYATINHAAREGARVAIVHTSAIANNSLPLPGPVVSAITHDMQAAGVDPSQIKSYVPSYTFCTNGGCYTDPSKITICKAVQLQNPSGNPTGLGMTACGMAISFQYPYQFLLPFTSLNNQKIYLTADVQMAEEH